MDITLSDIKYYLEVTQDKILWAYSHFSSWHPYVQIGIGLFLFLFILSLFAGRQFHKHKHNVKKSKKMIKKIARIQDPGKQITYMRKIDHFLFEEVVLSALSSMGFRIKRNKAYTGDGGLDGQVKIKGKWYLIQSKRYSNYINKTHVEEFTELCRKRKQPGLFVHTGRTGKDTSVVFQSSRTIHCVSGHLLSLMFDKNKKKYWIDLVKHHKI